MSDTSNRVQRGNISIAPVLNDFLVNEALPGTGIDERAFFEGLDQICPPVRLAQSRAIGETNSDARSDFCMAS